MEENLKQKTLSSLVWQFCQKLFGQLFSFIVTVILARLLMPEDYGVVALASMFNILVGIFISGSMDAALIQKKDADELDYNTVFFSSLFMSFIIYGVVYFGAPLFAQIYHNEMITPVMRVLALTMPIGALAMVQNATISRNLEFKKFFFATLIGQIVAAIVGILMAYKGYGPWALVAQSIISTVTNTLVMFFLVSWHPRLMFSWERFKLLFSFAWKKTMAGFIGTLCGQLKGYLVGGKYSASDLAFLNRGDGLPLMIANNLTGTIDSVLFPALSRINDDKDAVKRGMRRSMMTSSYILTPLFFCLATMSDKVVLFLYGENWINAIPFMQISCISCAIGILSGANLQALIAIGRTDELLKLEVYKKPVMIAILLICVFISPIAIAIGMCIYALYGLCLNTIPNSKLLHYTIVEQLNDVKAGILLSVLTCAIVYGIGLLVNNIYISIILQFVIGTLFYLTMSYFLKLEAFFFVKDTIIQIIEKRRNKN